MATNDDKEESIISPRRSKKKIFFWQLISAVLFIALIISVLFAITNKTETSNSPMTGNIGLVGSTETKINQKVVDDTISFLKEAFQLPEVVVKETKIVDGLYEITMTIEGQDMPIYTTTTGEHVAVPGIGLVNKEDVLKQMAEAKAQKKALEEEQAKVKVAEDYRINKESTIDDFKGKPAVIFFVGTYCGHCQATIPEFKTQIWDNYKDSANLWVNVIDDKLFVVDNIAQGYNATLDFDTITGESCSYIPSFVVLDEEGKVVLKSCGSEKGISDITSTLDELLG